MLRDTVIVADRSRISHFTRDGTFLDSRDACASLPNRSRVRHAHTGRASFQTESFPQGELPMNEVYRDTTVVRLFDRTTGEPGADVFRYPGQPRLPDPEARMVLTPILLSVEPLFMWGSDDHLYYSPNDAYRLDVIDAATGEPQVRVVVALDLPPVTPEMVDEQIERDRERLREAEERGDDNLRLYLALQERSKLPAGEIRELTNSMRMAEDGRFMMIRGDLDVQHVVVCRLEPTP